MGRKMAVMAAGAAAVLAGGVMPAAAAAVTEVPCSTPALVSAVSGAASGATLSLAQGCTYVLTSALPTVAQDLTINGNGATLHRSTASGTAAFTILTITAGTVTLNRLSFTNGNGAITVNNLATLIVTGGVFSGNTAANGGAINNTAASVVQVTGASFINNTATRDGGAMYVFTALGNQITDCTFLGNTAAGSGGAYWEWSNGTTISRSTFGGNKAATGGALYLDDQGSVITATGIHGNGATGDGGGIFDSPGGTPVPIIGSTITGNHAGGAGGGLDEESYGALDSVTNTTIAGNSAADGGGINVGSGVLINLPAILLPVIVPAVTAAATHAAASSLPGPYFSTAMPTASLRARIRRKNIHPCRLPAALSRGILPEAAEAAFTTRDPSTRREPGSWATEPSAGAAASTTTPEQR
jgi:hypothetical protein